MWRKRGEPPSAVFLLGEVGLICPAMDGNKKTLRRAALPTLALAVLALPLAGAGAQDAPGQQPLVADLSAESDCTYLCLCVFGLFFPLVHVLRGDP